MIRKLALCLCLAGVATPAAAYIGPGAGISFVGSLFTWIIGILVALFAILFWPIRALFRKARGGRSRGETGESPDAEDAAESRPDPTE